MAEIRAFAGIRPREELAQRIAALPMTSTTARRPRKR